MSSSSRSLAAWRVKIVIGVIIAFIVIFALLYLLGGSSSG
jgi:hypothetical protein